MDYFINYIKKMYDYYGLTLDIKFSNAEKKFRICALREEIGEYEDADTPEKELDALLDLLIFLLGTFYRQGYAKYILNGFIVIMDANMKKQVGLNKKRNNLKFDLIKPEGWLSPDLTKVLKNE